jgi:hypothetical protein
MKSLLRSIGFSFSANVSVWMTPDSVAKVSQGKYTAYLIRSRIDQAIESPSSKNLINGTHFSRTLRPDGNYRILSSLEFISALTSANVLVSWVRQYCRVA